MLHLKLRFILSCLLFLAIFLVWLYYGGHDIASSNDSHKFESINSLFAGLAFAGMLCAIFMQRAELNLQRKELERTARALEKNEIIANKNIYAQYLILMCQFHMAKLEYAYTLKDDIQKNEMRKAALESIEYTINEICDILKKKDELLGKCNNNVNKKLEKKIF